MTLPSQAGAVKRCRCVLGGFVCVLAAAVILLLRSESTMGNDSFFFSANPVAKSLKQSRWSHSVRRPGSLYRAGIAAKEIQGEDFLDTSGSSETSNSSWNKQLSVHDVASSAGDRADASTNEATNRGKNDARYNFTLFCFLWTTRRPKDEELMQQMRSEYSNCDGFAFFSDRGPPGPGIVQVEVATQPKPRESPEWLFHKNMVGVLQAWKYMCEHRIAGYYDWVINTELDHWVNVDRVREHIILYSDVLRRGAKDEKNALKGPVMFGWGNAFVLNRKFSKLMCDEWKVVGKVTNHPTAVGCPAWMENGTEWPYACSQDICYPRLVNEVLGKNGSRLFGPLGCRQYGQTNSMQVPFPLTCWQREGVNGVSPDDEKLVMQIAKAKSLKTVKELEGQFGSEWETWNMSAYVPIIHHLWNPAAHKLADELLR